MVIKALKNHLPYDTKKTDSGKAIYRALKPFRETAGRNAERLRAHLEKTGTQEPFTDVDILVGVLEGLKA